MSCVGDMSCGWVSELRPASWVCPLAGWQNLVPCQGELMVLDLLFGGKVFVLGGDWRQILPVEAHANRTTFVETCLKNLPLWSSSKQF
ncbi:ATP-dependent DNA helicase [Trichonephila clavipes]|nr:ATP-dependent DNA helicase [Trichonephila clavipes]